MSKQLREEYLALKQRCYRTASKAEKTSLLDEIVTNTGLHRKHVVSLLSGTAHSPAKPRGRRKTYGPAVVEALVKIWQATNWLCGKRLKYAIPTFLSAFEKRSEIKLSSHERAALLRISPATIDRLLSAEKLRLRSYSTTKKPADNRLRREIPIRTFSDFPAGEVGYIEADCVSHGGSSPKGAFLSTLVLVDIETAWTECEVLARKEDSAVAAALSKVVARLPFPMRGLDTDNGSEFINYLVRDWCLNGSIEQTRAREYKKNDQARVEQVNGCLVRGNIGYDRFEGNESLSLLAQLYENLCLYNNLFLPTQRLQHKLREGAKVRKTYDTATTPAQRVLRANVSPETKSRVQTLLSENDPIELWLQIRQIQRQLWSSARLPDFQKISKDSIAALLSNNGSESVMEQHVRTVRKRTRPARAAAPLIAPARTASEMLWNFLQEKNSGDEFTVTDVCTIANRRTVNDTVRRFIKNGVIERTARGCYRVVRPISRRENVSEKVRKYCAQQTGEFRSIDMHHLGARRKINDEMRRLVHSKQIIRVSKGVYLRPKNSSLR